MNPQIVHPEGNPGESYLIDMHSVVTGTMPNGKRSQIALHAVAIKHLRAGEIVVIDGCVYPRPCQLAAWDEMTVRDPLWRGIYPDAAAAILSMSHGMKTSVEPGKDFKAAEHTAGWNQWAFLIAWGWSLWQDKHRKGEAWPMERRWREMQAVGFTGGFPAFRQICSRLKLSVTKSRPNL